VRRVLLLGVAVCRWSLLLLSPLLSAQPGSSVTSSVSSGCRHSGLGSILTTVTWACARCALLGYLAFSCIYTCGPRRSRAVAGPSLGHIWICQSFEHLAEMLKDPEMALTVTQDEPRPGQVLRQPQPMGGRRHAVLAAVPQ
jgi:hypothetical protein